MGMRLKATGTAALGIAAYFFITSALAGPSNTSKAPNNSKRPDVAVFTIQFRPDGAHGGPPEVPYAITAGTIPIDGTAKVSPTTVKVAVLDGQQLYLAVVAPLIRGVRADVQCMVHVNGSKVAEQPWTGRSRGCSLHATVAL
jgi:hypothetical protein